jgi:hypothetical protein
VSAYSFVKRKESLVAQRVTVHMTDDVTGEVIEDGAGGTVSFAFDGTSYEIDLSDATAATFREAISDYVSAARKVSGSRGSRRGSSTSSTGRSSADELQRIREWAASNGYEVANRGRISGAVREAYAAAH